MDSSLRSNRLRPPLAVLVLVGLILFVAGPRAWARAPSRPNILFLFADDQRADTIGAWGNTHIRTPNIDHLARRGTSFRGNYCFGSNSGAVCLPSRAMLMSGRTWLDVPLDLHGVTLLPGLLREAGYTTFATGKWHNGEASFTRAFPRGRSVFFGGMADHTRVPIADVENGQVVNRRTASKFSCVEFADAAIEFLNAQRGEKPFFCYVAFTTPHDPRDPPESYREMYYKARPPLPENFRPLPLFENGLTKNIRDENLAPYPRTRAVISDQLCEYYGLITYHDEQVGRIIRTLAQKGLMDDTIIIYTADHGLALGSHGLLGKQSVYEHSMRSPLIIAGPGIPAGRTTNAFTYLLDLFPTICKLAGARTPDNLAGHDLSPLWKDEKAKVRDSVFLPFGNLMLAVRDDRWKLIVYPPINYRELFDLRTDPHELKNLAADPAQKDRIARLTDLLKSWQAKVGDTQPLTLARPWPKEVRFDDFIRRPDPWQPDWIVKKYFRDH